MGRPPRAAGEADRHAAADRARRGQPAWVRSSTPPPTTCAARAPTSATPIIKLSQAFSALGDHSNDIFSTVKNLSILVSALQDSTDLMRQLNQNLASVTGLLANDPNEVGRRGRRPQRRRRRRADVRRRQPRSAGHHVGQAGLGDTGADRQPRRHQADPARGADRVAELRQHLPAGPGVRSARCSTVNNFANPITFLCGAIQAASRLGAEQSAKLCVQYLAPIIKNRQYNFPPIGAEPLRRRAGAAQRGHLQRGLDAARLRSAATAAECRRRRPPAPASAGARRWRPPLRGARRRDRAPTRPTGLPGMMVPAGSRVMMRRQVATRRGQRCWWCWRSRCPAAAGAG